MIDWVDPDSPWWAKLRTAHHHLRSVRRLVDDFTATSPWTVETAPTATPGEVQYRLRVHDPVPVDLLTTVGDAVHNMRSALDCVAYVLAKRNHGGQLSSTDEKRVFFPVCLDRRAFDKTIVERLRGLFGPQDVRALTCVQPFAFGEEAAELGIEVSEQDAHFDTVYRLHSLSITDKHRHLPMTAWWPDLVYWAQPTDGGKYRWRPSRQVAYTDGALLGVLVNLDGTPPSVDAVHEVHLGLADFPLQGDLVNTLENWHMVLCDWVVQRVIVVAEGNDPPLLLPSSGSLGREY